jgi:hypothetical protein
MSVSCIVLYHAITESIVLSYCNILELLKWAGHVIIIMFINCNWVFTRWQWLIYMYTIAATFTSGGPHEKQGLGDYHITKKILGGSFRGKRPIGRHHSVWEHSVQMDAVSLLRIQNWKLVAQSREGWRKKIVEAMSRIWSKAPQETEIFWNVILFCRGFDSGWCHWKFSST